MFIFVFQRGLLGGFAGSPITDYSLSHPQCPARLSANRGCWGAVHLWEGVEAQRCKAWRLGNRLGCCTFSIPHLSQLTCETGPTARMTFLTGKTGGRRGGWGGWEVAAGYVRRWAALRCRSSFKRIFGGKLHHWLHQELHSVRFNINKILKRWLSHWVLLRLPLISPHQRHQEHRSVQQR